MAVTKQKHRYIGYYENWDLAYALEKVKMSDRRTPLGFRYEALMGYLQRK